MNETIGLGYWLESSYNSNSLGIKRFVSRISISFKCECHIIMQIQYAKNLNPGRFELVNALKRFCIIMQVQDKRDVVYEDRRTALLFPGEGQSLVDDDNGDKNLKVESHPPGSFD